MGSSWLEDLREEMGHRQVRSNEHKQGRRGNTRKLTENHIENGVINVIDQVAEFDEFRTQVAPKIKAMIKAGYTTERMRKEIAGLVQARVASIALAGDAKSAVTLKACQDVLDRHEGSAPQKIEVTRKYEIMSNDELKALAFQKLQDAGIIEAEYETVTPAKSPQPSARPIPNKSTNDNGEDESNQG